MNNSCAFSVLLGTATVIAPLTDCMAKGYDLNDTGVVTCVVAGGKISEQCDGTWTDADFGRDVTHPSSKNGAVGFSFTKLDERGSILRRDAQSWACVKDNVTGLVWENKRADGSIHDGTKKFDRITTPVDTLVLATNTEALCGYTDWRTPSRRELLSVLSVARRKGSVAVIDDRYFQNTANARYWTSDRYALSDRNTSYWTVDFNGFELAGRYNLGTEHLYARMVRSDKPYGQNDFVDNGTEVIDKATKLVWKRCVSGQAWDGNTCVGSTALMTIAEARAYSKVESETTGRMWRLANIKEFDSIIDTAKRASPAFDQTYFPKTFAWGAFALTISTAVVYTYRDGSTGAVADDALGSVRLVRDLDNE